MIYNILTTAAPIGSAELPTFNQLRQVVTISPLSIDLTVHIHIYVHIYLYVHTHIVIEFTLILLSFKGPRPLAARGPAANLQVHIPQGHNKVAEFPPGTRGRAAPSFPVHIFSDVVSCFYILCDFM